LVESGLRSRGQRRYLLGLCSALLDSCAGWCEGETCNISSSMRALGT